MLEKTIGVSLNLTFKRGWVIRLPHNLENYYSGFYITLDAVKVRSIQYRKVNGLRLKPGEFNYNNKFLFICLARSEKRPIITFQFTKHTIEDPNSVSWQCVKTKNPPKSLLYGLKKTKSKIKWGSSPSKGEQDRTLRIKTKLGDLVQVNNSLMLGDRLLCTVSNYGKITYHISPITETYLYDRIQSALEIGSDGKKCNMKHALMKHAPR